MSTNPADKINFRLATLVSLAIMFVIMLWVSKDFGISGDEYSQNIYGEKVLDYYASFGKDKSALSYKNIYYYGGFYDLLCAVVNKVVSANVYNTRHVINALFGFFALLFTGLLAKEYKGWKAALMAVWFLFLSPRFFGHSMNNPKDVPFALGMVMGIYFIVRFIKAFPKPTWKDSLWLALAIGYAIGIRVGGLILIPFLGVGIAIEYFFNWRKGHQLFDRDMKSLYIRSAVVAFVGYLVGLVFWPYALEAPFSHPFKALGEMSQFSYGIRMLFDDRHMMSNFVPGYYVPKWIFISSPIIILLGFVLSPILFANKYISKEKVFFLFFVTIFPWAYIVYKKSPLYDGWRHMLFIYPMICVLSSLAFLTVADMFKSKAAKYAVTAIVLVGLILPAKWSIANHPHEVTYFNEFIGGIDGAYGYYETDYYMNSVKKATYRLAKEKDLYHIKDTITIASNAIEPMFDYLPDINPKLKSVYVRYRERYNTDYDYGIFYTRFIDKELLQNGYFPPHNTIFTVDADNTPLTAVIEKDSAHAYSLLAYQAMEHKSYQAAVTYYSKVAQLAPNDETLYYNYAFSLANLGRMDESIAVLKKGLTYTPENIQEYQLLSMIYKAKGDMVNAQDAVNRANAIIAEQRGEE